MPTLTITKQDGKKLVISSSSSTDAGLAAHLTDTSGAHTSTAISRTPTATLLATDVEGALLEVEADAAAALAAANAAASGASSALAAHVAIQNPHGLTIGALGGDAAGTARPPTGAAGGSLSGTYPSPGIAAGAVGGTEIAAAIKDPIAGTPGLRTLGPGAQQAAAGNHAHALLGGFAAGFPNFGTRTIYSGRSDFAATVEGHDGFVSDFSGTLADVIPSIDAGRVGIAVPSTGTSTTGRAAIRTGYTCASQAGRLRVAWDLQIPVASTDLENFAVRVGWLGGVTGDGSGAYFRYRHSVNGGLWECVCRRSGIETIVATSDDPIALGYHQVAVEIAADASQALFYVNNALRGTIAANLPLAGNPLIAGVAINKSAGGTTRTVRVDSCEWSFEPTVAL